jgi:RNA polymerase sigma-70 factor (ECF subfamily)
LSNTTQDERPPFPVAVPDERRAKERRLVDRARTGDLSAFEELYRQNVGRVYGLCLRLLANASEAEELTQVVFVRAFEKLGSFRGESAFFSWLHPMATNLAFSERRSRGRREARITVTDDLTPFEGNSSLGRPGAGLDLERAIAALPPGARKIFVLHDVEGYRHDEIAAMTGLASGTSKAQLHRARKLLREALES